MSFRRKLAVYVAALVAVIVLLSGATALLYTWRSTQRSQVAELQSDYDLGTMQVAAAMQVELLRVRATLAPGFSAAGLTDPMVPPALHVRNQARYQMRGALASIVARQQRHRDPVFEASAIRVRAHFASLEAALDTVSRYDLAESAIPAEIEDVFGALEQLHRLHAIAYRERAAALSAMEERDRRSVLVFAACAFGVGVIAVLRLLGLMRAAIARQESSERAYRSLSEELERRVRERTDELARKDEELRRKERLATLGQITATVSHELRNPLATIRNSLGSLRKLVEGGPSPLLKPVERIDRNVLRCDRIIDELLDFTRIREQTLRPVALDDWIAGLLDEQPAPEGIAVRFEPGLPGAAVPLDEESFRRAFLNVYENACQAIAGSTGSGGHGQITVCSAQQGERVEIGIADSGPGIAPAARSRLFEPLFSTKNFGVGLGLVVVKRIMEQHQGGVEIQAPESGGARFVLWLPRDGTPLQSRTEAS